MPYIDEIVMAFALASLIIAMGGMGLGAYALVRVIGLEKTKYQYLVHNAQEGGDDSPLTDEQKEMLIKNSWEEDLIK